MLRPDASLMVNVPLSFKIHILAGFGILAYGRLPDWCMCGVFR